MYYEELDIVRILLVTGKVDADLAGKDGRTALHHAALCPSASSFAVLPVSPTPPRTPGLALKGATLKGLNWRFAILI